MARSILTEGVAVGGALTLTWWLVRGVMPEAADETTVFAAGFVGHLLFEALGLNQAFCRALAGRYAGSG